VPLYVGGITGKSDRFRARIGDLIADMFGFYGSTRTIGHSSGGRSLHGWAMDNAISLPDLHLAWVEDGGCHRCLEVQLHAWLRPKLNHATPSRCTIHESTPPATKEYPMRKIAKAPRPDTDPANYRPTSIKYRVYQGWLADGERGARAANALEQTPAVESTMKRWLWAGGPIVRARRRSRSGCRRNEDLASRPRDRRTDAARLGGAVRTGGKAALPVEQGRLDHLHHLREPGAALPLAPHGLYHLHNM